MPALKKDFSPAQLRTFGLAAVGTLVLFLVLAGLAMALAGQQAGNWQAALAHLTPASIALVVGGLFLNTLFRGLRYPLFMRRLHLRHVPAARLALYYVVGMAFSATPGKVGTAIRLWLLQRHHGIPMQRSAPLLLMDMLTDFIAIMLMIALSLPFLGAGGRENTAGVASGVLLLGGILAGLLALFRWPWLTRWGIKVLYRLAGRRKPRLFGRLLRLSGSLTRLLGWRTLLATVSLSLLAWFSQFYLLHLLLVQVNGTAPFTAPTTLFITATALIASNLTVVPGGVGSTEAALFAMLKLFGVGIGPALAYTVLMRIATLWLPVTIGFLALPFALTKKKQK